MISKGSNEVRIDSNDIVRIDYPNYDGHPDINNPNGCLGNFKLIITDEKAKEIEEKYAGRDKYAIRVKWNVNDKGEKTPSIKVTIRWDLFPPDVRMITNRGKKCTVLNEKTIARLNKAEVVDAAFIVGPSKMCGCYLTQGFFFINDNDLSYDYLPHDCENDKDDEVPFDV